MDFDYIDDKSSCWYSDICDKAKCDDFCIRHYKMSTLISMACLEGKMRHSIPLTPDSCDLKSYKSLKSIKDDITSFVSSGSNLLLYSVNTGNGKTEWSKKLMLSWFNSIWPYSDLECRGLFISIPKFMAAMKENISKPNDYYEYVNKNIFNTDLVIFDELNYKDMTPFELEYLLNVINYRVSTGKSCIYTTNYDLQTVESKLGTRLASRIIGNSMLIEFKGSDKRGFNK